MSFELGSLIVAVVGFVGLLLSGVAYLLGRIDKVNEFHTDQRHELANRFGAQLLTEAEARMRQIKDVEDRIYRELDRRAAGHSDD